MLISENVITARPRGEITPQSARVIVSTFVAAMLNSQLLASFAIAIFIQPLAQELGWGRGEIGAGVTFTQWGMASGAMLAGRFVDRLGPRRVMLPLTIVSGFAMMALSVSAGSILLFYACNLVAGACVPGSAGFGKMLALWFDRRRGLAISSLGIGAFVSIVLLPSATTWLLHAIGWRSTYLVFGGLILLVAVPVMAAFFREPPGAASDQAEASPATVRQAIGIGQLVISPIFWVLLGSQVGATFAYTGLTTHAIGLFAAHGLTSGQAALGLTLVGSGGLAAQIAAGYLLDRIETPRVVMPFALSSLLGVAGFHFCYSPPLLYLSAILFGVGCGGETSTTAYLISRYYGVRNFATVYGILKPALMCLAAPAPFFVGTLLDHYGSYGLALLMCGGTLLLCVICFAMLPPYPAPPRDDEMSPTGLRP